MPDGPLRLVVVADPIDPVAVELLRTGPCRVVDATAGAEALDRALPEAWGIIVRSRTKVNAALLAKAPHLQFVARAGVGVDNVDLPAATARGVRVANAPTAATVAVAELTVAFLLLLARGLYPRIVDTKAGGWKRGENGGELRGKTVGFVGYGRIAREVAKFSRTQPAPGDPNAIPGFSATRACSSWYSAGSTGSSRAPRSSQAR